MVSKHELCLRVDLLISLGITMSHVQLDSNRLGVFLKEIGVKHVKELGFPVHENDRRDDKQLETTRSKTGQEQLAKPSRKSIFANTHEWYAAILCTSTLAVLGSGFRVLMFVWVLDDILSQEFEEGYKTSNEESNSGFSKALLVRNKTPLEYHPML